MYAGKSQETAEFLSWGKLVVCEQTLHLCHILSSACVFHARNNSQLGKNAPLRGVSVDCQPYTTIEVHFVFSLLILSLRG